MAHDPYHHLHVEDYERPFDAGRRTWRDLVIARGRPTTSLDGEWRFVLDLHDEGLRQAWYRDEPGDPRGWSVPRDYDGGDWCTAPVPSCWNVLRPEWFYFEGSGWYTRDFATPPLADGERLILRVGAASYEARVFVNGTFAGGHRGASTPFCIDVTEAVRPEGNRLMIQVENRRRPGRVPMHHTDWFNYGGLYREVSLLVVPAVHLRHFRVALVPGSGFSRLAVEVELSAPVDDVARLAIPELGIDARVPVAAGRGATEIDARPELWSPASPRLYDVELACGADRVRDRIGFREIRREGLELLLNGEPLWLRGVCCHEDDVELGKCTSDDDIRRRLEHVRALGADAIRLAHYPHHERVAELADEAGVLLLEEIPVYWAIDFDSADTYADAENQLLEMIRRDGNRASVIAWGVGNENADTDARYSFMRRLVEAARSADPTRLVTAACLINRERFRIEDRLAAELDVIGINAYFGWYEPDVTDLGRLLESSEPDRPVVISECGADAVPGTAGGPGELFTEGHQAHVFDRQLDLVAAAPYVRGYFPWVLYDFRTERRQTGVQRGWNLKGLVDRTKSREKAAFATLRRRYEALDGCAQT